MPMLFTVRSRRARGLGEVEAGVRGHVEAAVTGTALAVAAREGEVDVDAADAEHTERATNRMHVAESREKGFEPCPAEAEHLDVDVLGAQPEKMVSHPAAHDDGPAARIADGLRDCDTPRIEPGRGIGCHGCLPRCSPDAADDTITGVDGVFADGGRDILAPPLQARGGLHVELRAQARHRGRPAPAHGTAPWRHGGSGRGGEHRFERREEPVRVRVGVVEMGRDPHRASTHADVDPLAGERVEQPGRDAPREPQPQEVTGAPAPRVASRDRRCGRAPRWPRFARSASPRCSRPPRRGSARARRSPSA